ncbi:MAG: hypothetical protein II870_00455, partial [Synergistaceae bacterium]|nr:hypothetical protein [Synergistaceae bacterium]
MRIIHEDLRDLHRRKNLIMKKLTGLLGAVLVLTLAFGSAAFAVKPTPIESRRNGGTVTFKISFDLAADEGLVTDGEAKKSTTPYAPEFTGLEAYKGSISTLFGFNQAAAALRDLDSGDAYTRSALVELIHAGDLYGTLYSNTTLKKLAEDLV